jgi:uncharacterized membrane protein required for colicin V production
VNPVDAAVLCLVGVGAVLGARRGLIAQLARLLALAGGLVAARIVSPEASAAVRAAVPSLVAPVDRYVAYLAVFGLVTALVAWGAAELRERVRAGPFAPVDRAGGAVLGGAKGLLLCYVGLFVLICFPARPLARELRASIAAPALLAVIGIAAPLFPPEFEARGREVARDIAVARARERGAAESLPAALPPADPREPITPLKPAPETKTAPPAKSPAAPLPEPGC